MVGSASLCSGVATGWDGGVHVLSLAREVVLKVGHVAEQQVATRIDEDDAEKVLSNVVDFPTMLTNAPKFKV